MWFYGWYEYHENRRREVMRVPAPEGYHWMKKGNTYQLMKDPKDGYKPHKGASKSANFKIQKVHKK